MNAALRTTLGWIAAVLVNVGAVLFVVGLILPRTGGAPVLVVGIAALLTGALVGVGWMLTGRR